MSVGVRINYRKNRSLSISVSLCVAFGHWFCLDDDGQRSLVRSKTSKQQEPSNTRTELGKQRRRATTTAAAAGGQCEQAMAYSWSEISSPRVCKGASALSGPDGARECRLGGWRLCCLGCRAFVRIKRSGVPGARTRDARWWWPARTGRRAMCATSVGSFKFGLRAIPTHTLAAGGQRPAAANRRRRRTTCMLRRPTMGCERACVFVRTKPTDRNTQPWLEAGRRTDGQTGSMQLKAPQSEHANSRSLAGRSVRRQAFGRAPFGRTAIESPGESHTGRHLCAGRPASSP